MVGIMGDGLLSDGPLPGKDEVALETLSSPIKELVLIVIPPSLFFNEDCFNLLGLQYKYKVFLNDLHTEYKSIYLQNSNNQESYSYMYTVTKPTQTKNIETNS